MCQSVQMPSVALCGRIPIGRVLRAERPAARLAALFAPEIGTRNLTRGEEGASPTAEASRLKRDSTPKPDPDGPYSRIRTAIDQRGAFYMRPLVDKHEAGCQRKGGEPNPLSRSTPEPAGPYAIVGLSVSRARGPA